MSQITAGGEALAPPVAPRLVVRSSSTAPPEARRPVNATNRQGWPSSPRCTRMRNVSANITRMGSLRGSAIALSSLGRADEVSAAVLAALPGADIFRAVPARGAHRVC